jgi:hypothetical protein
VYPVFLQVHPGKNETDLVHGIGNTVKIEVFPDNPKTSGNLHQIPNRLHHGK